MFKYVFRFFTHFILSINNFSLREHHPNVSCNYSFRKNDRLLFTKRKSTSKRSNSILTAHANGHLYLRINLLCWFQYIVARKSHGSMLDLIIIYVQFLFCTKKLLQLKCLSKGENNFLLAKLISKL